MLGKKEKNHASAVTISEEPSAAFAAFEHLSFLDIKRIAFQFAFMNSPLKP